MNRKLRNELGLLIAVVAAAGSSLLIQKSVETIPPSMAVIEVDGERIAELPLDTDTDLLIEGIDGGTNHLIIENGQAFVDEATCPDKICISQGHISQSGETIVCLPNRVVITIQ